MKKIIAYILAALMVIAALVALLVLGKTTCGAKMDGESVEVTGCSDIRNH